MLSLLLCCISELGRGRWEWGLFASTGSYGQDQVHLDPTNAFQTQRPQKGSPARRTQLGFPRSSS